MLGLAWWMPSMTTDTQFLQPIAHYRVGPAVVLYSCWLVATVLLGICLVYPTEFMRVRPVFSVLVGVGFVASLSFVLKFFALLGAILFRDKVAIYVEQGGFIRSPEASGLMMCRMFNIRLCRESRS